MGNNYDIILIALVAVFLILRLRAVLGKRTGNERPPARDPFTPPAPPPAPSSKTPRIGDAPIGNDNVVPMPGTLRPSNATSGPGGIRATVLPSASAGVAAIRTADSQFDPTMFVQGARAAFTTIVEAFAKGDTPALRPLLDPPTFASFEGAIRGRNERREKAETTLIGFEASDISSAELQGSQALVTVRFVTEQINVVRNAEGQIADGNPNEVQKVVDLWTFRRDTKSSDPNWVLIKTESEG
ncbi:Predicted lipid-binding transport protein, Tim44 family [Enhydrobacter aerosaccus]|uniref:Predicted lipid-binding transport protein, Tim44 family n=1 Tax=Enhydrobacter aerosaccus TaxID=225324 RepID=A0A1T4QPL0_9HYPH|nr:Tim44/TimA family putative adaptor protein [Enhydrobacter aerosaccus]SKA05722.1 Predicted lipid-binding transport protein, Tim44 family [Enhydrobacter aerosaccus]